MTTNKPGSVKQQPHYGCTSCYEEWTWPASYLRIYDGECWCNECWDESRYDYPDHPDWRDLEPYTPALQAENDALHAKTSMSLGVGDGTGNLFVHGDYDSIMRVQALIFECEKLRKDVGVLVEALQAITRNELDAQRAQYIAAEALDAYLTDSEQGHG